MGRRQAVRQRALNPPCVGSNPAAPAARFAAAPEARHDPRSTRVSLMGRAARRRDAGQPHARGGRGHGVGGARSARWSGKFEHAQCTVFLACGVRARRFRDARAPLPRRRFARGGATRRRRVRARAGAVPRAQVQRGDRRARRVLAAHPRDARALVLRGDCEGRPRPERRRRSKTTTARSRSNPEYQYAYVTRCETRLELDDLPARWPTATTRCGWTRPTRSRTKTAATCSSSARLYALALSDYDKAIELGRTKRVHLRRALRRRAAGRRNATGARPTARRRWRSIRRAGAAVVARPARAARVALHRRHRRLERVHRAKPEERRTPRTISAGSPTTASAAIRLALEDLRTYVQRESRPIRTATRNARSRTTASATRPARSPTWTSRCAAIGRPAMRRRRRASPRW